MPSVRYYNQTAPFWDFVANLEEQGSSHSFFAGGNRNNNNDNDNDHDHDNENHNEPPNPWRTGNWGGIPFGPFAFRGRQASTPAGPPPAAAAEGNTETEAGPSDARDPPPPFSDDPEEETPREAWSHHHHHRAGPHRGRGGPRGMGGGPCGRGRGRGGPWGGRYSGHFHPYAGAGGPFGAFAQMFSNQLFGEDTNTTKDKTNEDFKPDVDVFDTSEAFVVHASLPGAKKEDVAVNWDSEKSELSITGIAHRPGDEELLKTLALDERKVGAFERKVRLGSRANPAQIDVDAITARLEDGVLRIEVPKLDAGYVEIKKVDIE